MWRRAHVFAIDIKQVTKTFPRTGYRDLKSQLSRAAESIASNIVEGCAAASRKEFARFLDISIKSASEVDYRLELARDHGVLPYRVWKPLAAEVVEIRKMLSALRRAVLAAKPIPPATDAERAEQTEHSDPASDETRSPQELKPDDKRPSTD